MQNGPKLSAYDAVGNAAGYGLVLVVVAVLRELFGSGKLLGYSILPTVSEGGWYVPKRPDGPVPGRIHPDRLLHLGGAQYEARAGRGGVPCWSTT